MLPPPFPFTPFIIVMSAMQYPRWRMLGIVAVGRVVRFSLEGVLAIIYGRQILEMAKNSVSAGNDYRSGGDLDNRERMVDLHLDQAGPLRRNAT